MLGFNPKTIKYAYPNYPWENDSRGYYFPDSVIEPFLTESKTATQSILELYLKPDTQLLPLNRHLIKINKPDFSWDKSCQIVIEAFKKFDPDLGHQALTVINNPSRWIVRQPEPGESASGCMNPAHCKENPNPYAVINFTSDKTINDPIYMAHELGHLIADDWGNESGFTHLNTQSHMREVQAFFTQYILYDYLFEYPDTNIQHAAKLHFTAEIGRMPLHFPISIGALKAEHLKSSGGSEQEMRDIFEETAQEWLGRNWSELKKALHLSKHIGEEKQRDTNGLNNLYTHPMAAIIAAAMYLKTRPLEDNLRKQVTENLLNKNNPITICDLLQETGIENEAQLQDLAKKTIFYIETPFDKLIYQPPPSPATEVPDYKI